MIVSDYNFPSITFPCIKSLFVSLFKRYLVLAPTCAYIGDIRHVAIISDSTYIAMKSKQSYCITQNFEWGEILTDSDSYNIWQNILTDVYCLSPYICKRCIVFKQFYGLNFDGLAGKHQNVKPPVKILHYTVYFKIFTYHMAISLKIWGIKILRFSWFWLIHKNVDLEN